MSTQRTRVRICNDGLEGPYIVCDSDDLTPLRVFLANRKITISFDPTTIVDGSTANGKSWASHVNLNDIPAGIDLDELQKEIDTAFPYNIDG